ALALGVVLAAGLALAAPWLAGTLGAGDALDPAVVYLRWSAPGLPGMLVVLAATGVLRGLLDTRTPLWVAVGGAVLNAALTVTLVLGAGMGIAGSALGTSITQLLMALVLGGVVVRGARGAAVPLRPGVAGLGAAVLAGLPLLARTATLRAAIVLATWVAGGLGAVTLAGHQAVVTIWGLTAFALDALAIAAQALVGQALGAGGVDRARGVLRRTLTWGVGAGVLLAAVVGALAWPLARLFTDAPAVHRAVALTLLLVALTLPVSGWVFVLDGVLIGAGDGRYLAWAGLVTVAVYAPAAVAVRELAPSGAGGLVWSWAAFAGLFMLARAVTTGARARGRACLRVGA
ncbi:MAG TPA: MATE family efflux transporter, partial [Actinotalea sp.]|nr:MATE family efflux transporter [Actinotalea sp.]